MVFSGCRNSIVDGTCPEKTAVACLSILFSNKVRPIQADSWSTDGLLLTVTKILDACLMRSTICCLAAAWSIFYFIWCYYRPQYHKRYLFATGNPRLIYKQGLYLYSKAPCQ